MKNQSEEIVFILLGLTGDPQLQILIFLFLFFNYILSLMGNLVIILLTLLDPRLKTPMYFFLRNFSCLEIAFTTVWTTEFYLLAAMSYDRYVAICRPLHYPIIMNSKLSCTDTSLIELMAFVLAVMTLVITLILVILSYTLIIKTILKFPSAQQRRKAFSTCSSHMVVVSITYGSCIFMYMKTSAKERVTLNKEDEDLWIASRLIWFDQPRPPDSSQTAPVKIGPSP
ncbi:hypothetical protein STEG23_032555 [Scotinomys teguina]